MIFKPPSSSDNVHFPLSLVQGLVEALGINLLNEGGVQCAVCVPCVVGDTGHHDRHRLPKTYFIPSIELNLLQVSRHLCPHKTVVKSG